MPSRWAYFVCCALGCSGRGVPSAATAPAVGSSVPTPPTSASPARTRAPTQLERRFTGQAQPSLLVKNGFPIAQHLFIDWTHQGVLAPASSQSFQLSPGTHTLTCADSSDPDDHPAAVTEAFDAGYTYVYTLRPGD